MKIKVKWKKYLSFRFSDRIKIQFSFSRLFHLEVYLWYLFIYPNVFFSHVNDHSKIPQIHFCHCTIFSEIAASDPAVQCTIESHAQFTMKWLIYTAICQIHTFFLDFGFIFHVRLQIIKWQAFVVFVETFISTKNNDPLVAFVELLELELVLAITVGHECCHFPLCVWIFSLFFYDWFYSPIYLMVITETIFKQTSDLFEFARENDLKNLCWNSIDVADNVRVQTHK